MKQTNKQCHKMLTELLKWPRVKPSHNRFAFNAQSKSQALVGHFFVSGKNKASKGIKQCNFMFPSLKTLEKLINYN